MATITKRLNSKGELSYRAQVRVKKNGRTVFSEARTFPTQKLAKDWAARLEHKLKEPGEMDRRRARGVGLGELIDTYLADPEVVERVGRTKRYALQLVRKWPIAEKPAGDLTSADLIEHARDRKAAGTGPATIAHDISYIKSVLEYARLTLLMPVSGRVVEDAMPQLQQLDLVSKSRQRERRPEEGELQPILAALRDRSRRAGGFIPSATIVEFSIYSAMRISETCRLRWDDLDEQSRTVVIRQRKDPRKKKLNDQVVPLLGEAWDIVMAQPRIDERIFPYNARSVSAAWQRVRNKLGIEDLRFHDLRHEGTSRLFELGHGIHEVSMVNGNRSWATLKRYTNLKPELIHTRHAQLVAAAKERTAALPASAPAASAPRVKRRFWLARTPDGYLYPLEDGLGFVDQAADAWGWPDEQAARAALAESGGEGDVERVLREV
ncbi:tyrosine-type recombinase/integrase [Chromobacterium violaceum]|uniref:tyrosine-type recombinase/integrase n=1 Tax=Chromobacterium violaceum TaxID=536 RepID=UPI001CE15721|nr:site-specific integrase [Chromobacterium violaceum]